MQRRHFIQAAGIGAASLAAPALWAQSQGNRT
ncbi:MAG: twin-arginine translocation signal domain-containing protein [Polaromonas sp.]